MTARFITPQDVLLPRGNRAFGQAGEHGAALELPWPSAFAGALRSTLLARDPAALAAFPARPAGALGDVLGTPEAPGSFRLSWLSFALRDAGGAIEPVVPLPADRTAIDLGDGSGLVTFRAARPARWPDGVAGSGALPMTALLRDAPRGKPASALLVGREALERYLNDDALRADGAMPQLMSKELRLGIALDAQSRTAAEGALYTSEALRFARRDEPLAPGGAVSAHDAGYLVVIDGDGALLAPSGMLRLGGDGRAARHEALDFEPPSPPLERIERDRRFKLVLTTPALWPTGWLPPQVQNEGGDLVLRLPGASARLACAASARHDVVSGWNLVTRRPKTAQRAVPAGSVYWFDRVEGDAGKLAAWTAQGVWPNNADAMRRAEGFNNALLAVWHNEE